MADNTKKGRVYLRNVRLSYPHLAEPHASVEGGQKKYRATFIIDPTTADGKKNVMALNAEAMRICKETWPKSERPPIKPERKCLKKGDDITAQDGTPRAEYAGMVVLTAASDDQPKLMYRDKRDIEPYNIKKVLYPGCRVEAMVSLYPITDPKRGGNGLFASVDGVRFYEDDESFGRAPVSAADFDDLDDEPAFTASEEDGEEEMAIL